MTKEGVGSRQALCEAPRDVWRLWLGTWRGITMLTIYYYCMLFLCLQSMGVRSGLA